jgi:hypothetical protein
VGGIEQGRKEERKRIEEERRNEELKKKEDLIYQGIKKQTEGRRRKPVSGSVNCKTRTADY